MIEYKNNPNENIVEIAVEGKLIEGDPHAPLLSRQHQGRFAEQTA